MDDAQPSPEEVRIGLFGWFNPHILTKGWLESEGLLGPSTQGPDPDFYEGESMVAVSLGGVRLEVTYDRFVVSADWVAAEVAKAFVVQVFQRLSHTPIKGIVIGWSWRYDSGPGRDIAWLEDVSRSSGRFFSSPDMVSFGAPRSDGLSGRQSIQIETEDDDEHRFLNVTFLDEVEVAVPPTRHQAEDALELLEKLWVTSRSEAASRRRSLSEALDADL